MQYKVLKWPGPGMYAKFERELNSLAEDGWTPLMTVGEGHLLLQRPGVELDNLFMKNAANFAVSVGDNGRVPA
jgi:hypothetical protein